ncbi:MAG: hypothetical protein AB7I35_12180 [Ramlibacter sp.]
MSRPIPITVYAVLCAGLVGCAMSSSDMRADPEAKRSFTVPAGYQVVLKRIEDYNSECNTVVAIPMGGDGINEVRNYSDLRKATITRGIAAIVPNIYQVIELNETAPETTEVTVYAKLRLERVALVFEHVARGANKGCVP